jgi:predicted RNA binding protein YcfA (HicA-like mRNA interferase family)
MTAPTDYRGFAQVLRGLGAAPVRQRGGHEQWRLPNGKVFTLPATHAGYVERRAVLNRWCDLRRLCSADPPTNSSRPAPPARGAGHEDHDESPGVGDTVSSERRRPALHTLVRQRSVLRLR